MKVTFVTTNAAKFEEARYALKDYPVELERSEYNYSEDQEMTIEEIAMEGARVSAEHLGVPVVVDDTGIFFEAYPGFPGPLSKFVYHTLGFKGILKLLEGENRGAYFLTVLGYCEPGREPRVFIGKDHGTLSEEVCGEINERLPYCNLFISDGDADVNALIPIEEKNRDVHHRIKAFRTFGEWMKKNL